MKYASFLIILLMSFCLLGFGENDKTIDPLYSLFESLPDSPSEVEFASFLNEVKKVAHFNPGIPFTFNGTFETSLYKILGLGDFYDSYLQNDERKLERSRESEDISLTRDKLKQYLLWNSLPALVLESNCTDPKKDDINLRVSYSLFICRAYRQRYAESLLNPFTKQIAQTAIEGIEKFPIKNDLDNRYQSYIENRANQLEIAGDNLQQQIASVMKLANEKSGDYLYLITLLHWLELNIPAEAIFVKPIPNEILLEVDHYDCYSIVHEYVQSWVFGDLDKLFIPDNGERIFRDRTPGVNLLLVFVGSFLVDAIMNREDGIAARNSILFRFHIGVGNHFDYCGWPSSFLNRYSRYIKECRLERTYGQYGNSTQPRHFLKLVEESEGASCWFIGNYVPATEIGSRRVESDFVYPIIKPVCHPRYQGFLDGIESDAKEIRELLGSTDSFEWNKYYSIKEHDIEREYPIEQTVHHKYTLAGAAEHLADGWLEKIMFGHAKYSEPVEKTVQRLDRAVYYHYAKTRLRVYQMASPGPVSDMFYPVFYVEVTPDASVRPDECLASYIVKGKDWVRRTNIHSLAYDWWCLELVGYDWYKEKRKQVEDLAVKANADFEKDSRATNEANWKWSSERNGKSMESKAVVDPDAPTTEELKAHFERVYIEYRQAIEQLPDEPDENDKRIFFDKMKSILKLVPSAPSAVRSGLPWTTPPSAYCLSFFCIPEMMLGMPFMRHTHFASSVGHTISTTTKKDFFIETCFVRLLLEGEFERRMLRNQSLKYYLKDEKALEEYRYQAAFILMGLLRLRENALIREDLRESHTLQMAELDNLDAKYKLTERYMQSVKETEKRLDLASLPNEVVIKRLKSFLFPGDKHLPELTAMLNWLFSTCPNSLFLDAEPPDVIPVKDIVKYNTLLSRYVKPDYLNQKKNSWSDRRGRTIASPLQIVTDIRVLSTFFPCIINGEDASLLRSTYFANAFGMTMGDGIAFNTLRILTTGEAQKSLDKIYKTSILPTWKMAFEACETPEFNATVIREGKLKDIWLPLYVKTTEPIGTFTSDDAYPIPVLFSHGRDEFTNALLDEKGSAFSFYKSTNVLKQDFSQNTNDTSVRRYKCPLRLNVPYDFSTDALAVRTVTTEPWESPIPGLSDEQFSGLMKGVKTNIYERVVFAHYPSVTWKAFSSKENFSPLLRKPGRYSNFVAYSILPGEDDVPDQFVPGMLNSSGNGLFDRAVPQSNGQYIYPHILRIRENPTCQAMLDTGDELLEEVRKLARLETENISEKKRELWEEWGGRGDFIYWLFDMPIWSGE